MGRPRFQVSGYGLANMGLMCCAVRHKPVIMISMSYQVFVWSINEASFLYKTAIATDITANTHCLNVVTNCDYEPDLHYNPTILKVGMVCRTYIMPEDLEHFLEPEKAQQAFDVLDVDGDGQVTLHNIRDAVVNIYQVLGCWDCLHVHTLGSCNLC